MLAYWSLRGTQFADSSPHHHCHFQQQSSKRSDCAQLFSMPCSEPLWLSFCSSWPARFCSVPSAWISLLSPRVLLTPSFSPLREQLKCHSFRDLTPELKYLHCPPPLTDLPPGHSQSLACSLKGRTQAGKPSLVQILALLLGQVA